MTLTEVLTELGIPYKEVGEHHHATSGWIQTECPQCSRDSSHFRLGINTNQLYGNCWTCGHINIIQALSELSNQSPNRIKSLLFGLSPNIPTKRQEAPKGTLTLPKGLTSLLPAHREYLKGRGFDPDELERVWGVQGLGIAPRLGWRLFIPIHYQGEIVSWTTRGITSREPRYVNAKPKEESVRAKDLLFGEDYIRSAVLVTEGPLDAIRVGPGAVATMGIAYTRAQLHRMTKYPTRVVCFDNEDKAQERAGKLCNDLSVFPGRTINVRLKADDPGSATKREIKRLRRKFLT